MDYYSFDSEVIESLNLLRPPVKRNSANRDFSVFNSRTNNNFKVLREFGHKLKTKRINSCKQTSHEGSSTSLILKKTTDSQQIFKQYSVVNYTSLHCQEQSTIDVEQNVDTDVKNQNKYKPLIQVTVIPKSSQNTASKLLRKQRIIANAVQETSSCHENSIQTKNVYLVVAGRKKDKIYEIKTTGSEKFEKESVKDEVENLSNFKHFIKTINMEKKRKKDKKKDTKIDNRSESYVEGEKKQSNVNHICKCLPDEHEVRPGKSRVRIFGRIGVTEDDQYILKCQATVNNKPVVTSQLPVVKQSSSTSLATFSRNIQTTSYQKVGGLACVRGEDSENDSKSLRDSIMQTDFRITAVDESPKNNNSKQRISKDSQSTQVNFYKPNGNHTNKANPFRTSEQITRCNCSNDFPVIKTINNGYDGKHLKSCQSPLVIISVFPKQDTDISNLVQTVQHTQIDNKRPLQENILTKNTVSKTDTAKNKYTKKSTRSRSPSPKGQKMKPKTIARNESPLRKRETSKLGKNDLKKRANSPKQKLEYFNSSTKKESTDKKRKLSPPRNPRPKTPPVSPNMKELQKKNASRQSLKQKPKSTKGKVDKGMNTEHIKTKKALVDSYTNKITEQMKSRFSKEKENPERTISKVSMNIDNQNEMYDLSFHQDKFTTGLKVRKTVKEASAQKSFDENQRHGSMENFLPYMSTKHERSSVCHRSICENLNLSDDYNNNPPRLTLRDSLEIGHRREDKVIKITQTHQPDNDEITVNSADMDFLAPIKHYTGDDCTICDPIERDKEIRELLGVEGRRSKLPYTQAQDYAMGKQISRHCFYSSQCKKTFITAFALSKTNSCECTEDNESSINVMHATEPLSAQNEEKNKANAEHKSEESSDDDECECICLTRNLKTLVYEHNPQGRTCPCDKSDNLCALPTCEKFNQTQLNKTEQLSGQKTHRNADNLSEQKSRRLSKKSEEPEQNTQGQTDELSGQEPQRQSNKTQLADQKSLRESNKTQLADQKSLRESNKTKMSVQKSQRESIKAELASQKSQRKSNKIEMSSQKSHRESNKAVLTGQKTHLEPNEAYITDQKNNDDNANENVEQTHHDDVIAAKHKANSEKKYEVPNLDRTSLYQQLTLNRNIQIFLQVEQFAKQKPIVLSRKQYDKIKKTIQHTVGRDKRCVCNRSSVSVGPTFGKTHDVLICTNREVQTDTRKEVSIKEGKKYFKSKRHSKKEHMDTVVLFSNETRGSFKDKTPPKVVVRRAASSLEVRNASIAYWKHVTFSSTNVGSIGSSSFALRNKKSVETIFRGHKKSLTPNLGTSAFSLLSEVHLSESRSMKICSPDAKAKKPFLKRLMSCLVLRSKTSEKGPGPVSNPPSVNSSVDSYHISTSLGAIDMTSSIYDTSASFYSNHSIHPLSNKFKRSFFNSVRGFLTSRKS